MSQLITEIWSGLRDAGLPEVMLYLPDHTASRCHWDDTAVIGGVRVALLADQERKIVRVLPVDTCTGIGIASPKGTDPSGYKAFVQVRLNERFGTPGGTEVASVEPAATAPAAAVVVEPQPPPPPPAVEPEPPAQPSAKPDTLASRWGIAPKPAARLNGTAVAHSRS